ncbi:hypothetical protein GQ54DRAFT_296931 [Martensiomyces pterosporus]|nr:hypothetical protein GQ54DRAFT_296931 [Martensiomyces pterosporus]
MHALNLVLFAVTLAHAKQVVRNWDITYLTTNRGLDTPPKRGITVNGAFPIPAVEATIGDTLVLNIHNSLDVPTSLHTHGIFQRGTNYYDGVSMTTECSTAPGSNFTYRIPLNQAGTFWIHGHTNEQLFDGLRIPLIIHDQEEPYEYDDEFTLAVEDWWPITFDDFLAMEIAPRASAMPLDPPPRLLVNGLSVNGTQSIGFEPGNTYRIRLIAMLSMPLFEFSIDDHDLQVIEVDSINTKPKTVKVVQLAAGQRVSVLVKAKDSAELNYNFHVNMLADFLPKIPGTFPSMFNGTVVYSPSAPLFNATSIPSEPFDDLSIETLEDHPLLEPDRSIFLYTPIGITAQFSAHESFNYIAYEAPKVPTMFSALTTGGMSLNPITYGPQTNAQVLKYQEVVEVIVWNTQFSPHPFHLHGHAFQIVERGQVSDTTGDTRRAVPSSDHSPVTRDTVYVPQDEYAVIRFRADNPGAWLFHCHFDLHMGMGLNMVFVEAPEMMRKVISVPQSVVDQCKQRGIGYSGNVVGHTTYNYDGAAGLGHLIAVPGL